MAERKLTKTASYFDNKPNNNHTDDAEELAKSTEEVAKVRKCKCFVFQHLFCQSMLNPYAVGG